MTSEAVPELVEIRYFDQSRTAIAHKAFPASAALAEIRRDSPGCAYVVEGGLFFELPVDGVSRLDMLDFFLAPARTSLHYHFTIDDLATGRVGAGEELWREITDLFDAELRHRCSRIAEIFSSDQPRVAWEPAFDPELTGVGIAWYLDQRCGYFQVIDRRDPGTRDPRTLAQLAGCCRATSHVLEEITVKVKTAFKYPPGP
jgi:hypothetical protein